MDNKLSELSKPVGHFVEWQDAETGEKEWCECSKKNGAPLYSQEYVSALLSKIEADREIKARLCRESNSLHDGLKAADKRISALLAELEKAQRANNCAPAILRQLAEEKQKRGEVAAATAFNYAASALQKELSK